MRKSPAAPVTVPLYVKLLAVVMTFVVSGLGVLTLATGHVAERWTRYGYAGPLEGGLAPAFGLSMFFFGLLPLMLLMRSPKAAAWLGGVAGFLGLLAVFAGPWLLG